MADANAVETGPTWAEEVPHAEWRGYLEAFSRQHHDWLASVVVEEAAGRSAPVEGALEDVALTDGDAVRIVLRDRDQRPVETRFERVHHMRVTRTTEGAESALKFDSSTGGHATVTLRVPMPPEMVDGVADGSKQ